jgi:hypothetical protein
MKMHAKILLLSFCVGAALSPVRADIPPPPPPQPKAVDAFADDRPNCLEWTDGCTICKRQPDGSAGCSTVGAACVQTAPVCLSQKTAP